MKNKLIFMVTMFIFYGCQEREIKKDWSVKKGSFVAHRDYQDDMIPTLDIVVIFDDKTETIKSDNFRYVYDWSDNYSREDYGTAWLINEREIVFSGCLNHSREILFIYDCQIKQIKFIPNVIKFEIDLELGWYLLIGPPLYSDPEDGQYHYQVLANGELITNLQFNKPRLDMQINFNHEGINISNIEFYDNKKIPFHTSITLQYIPFPVKCFLQTSNNIFFSQ